MARLIVALFALIASAAAFAPAASTMSALRPSTARFGYVPDGMSAAQYKDMQAKEAKKKADNKKKGWGAGRTGQELSLTEFQRKRDEKFPNTPGAGHMCVFFRRCLARSSLPSTVSPASRLPTGGPRR